MSDQLTQTDVVDSRITAEEAAEAAYFERRYGLTAGQLTNRAKLEAAARRLTD